MIFHIEKAFRVFGFDPSLRLHNNITIMQFFVRLVSAICCVHILFSFAYKKNITFINLTFSLVGSRLTQLRVVIYIFLINHTRTINARIYEENGHNFMILCLLFGKIKLRIILYAQLLIVLRTVNLIVLIMFESTVIYIFFNVQFE